MVKLRPAIAKQRDGASKATKEAVKAELLKTGKPALEEVEGRVYIWYKLIDGK